MNPSRVLIIENELLIANEISLILEEEGFETVIGITKVNDAIEILEKEKFDLVLIDIHLDGGINGCEIGTYLLHKNHTPYMYVTSNSDGETIDSVKKTRPHGIIIKPFKPIDIITTTAIVLNNYFYKDIDIFKDNHLNNITVQDIPYVLKKVIAFVDNNIYEKIDIEDLVGMTKWSRIHFYNIFTKYLGVSPYKYVLQRKVEQAKVVICNSDLNMQEIAIDLGFDSYSNFFKAFKKFTGVSPEYYKKTRFSKKYLK